MVTSPKILGWCAITLLILICQGSILWAVPAPEGRAVSQADIDKAEKMVREQFKPLQSEGAPDLTLVSDKALANSFPSDIFFALYFRMFPVARLAPEPLKSQNIFAVLSDGKVQHLTDTKELEAFFGSHIRQVKNEEAAKEAVHSWLLLSQWLKQDGFFKFAISEDSLSATTGNGKTKASGTATVVGGGKGDFNVLLQFDGNGKLMGVNESNNVKEGVRPICQATKLLDTDPIVRRMAEKDILVMGRSAKNYLEEQRKKASPELKKAIDQIWKRILEEGW